MRNYFRLCIIYSCVILTLNNCKDVDRIYDGPPVFLSISDTLTLNRNYIAYSSDASSDSETEYGYRSYSSKTCYEDPSFGIAQHLMYNRITIDWSYPDVIVIRPNKIGETKLILIRRIEGNWNDYTVEETVPIVLCD